MKKILCTFFLIAFSSSAHAYNTIQTPPTVLGADYELPYKLLVNKSSANDAGNMNVGFDYNYFFNDSLALSFRYGFDVVQRTGTLREQFVTPGLQYHWFQGHTWMPFIRADLPVTIKGAPNANGDDWQQDLGFSFGSGVAWNLGDEIGINHLVFKYDFSFTYNFGLLDAESVLALNFFRVGAEYRF